jgi:hypothetical protein
VALLKAVTVKMVIKSFKIPSLAVFFVAICELIYFYTSLAYSTDLLIYVAVEQIINRSTFASLINFGSNSMLLVPNKRQFLNNYIEFF